VGDRIIDCCSLINLYTGWRGLSELRLLGNTWFVADAILAEAQYTREIDSNGKLVTVALSLDELVRSGNLQRARPETPDEIDWYVRLARELDDGEAQALAIAKMRGYMLLTDDAKAARIARTSALSVETTSTVAVLQDWLATDPSHQVLIREVVRRITTLARFKPSKGDSGLEWWLSMLQGETT
jgi:predicted nucleic acid-binding protein